MIPKNAVWNGNAWIKSTKDPIPPIRKLFEIWARKQRRIALELDYGGVCYFDDRTQLAWEAWQIAWGEAYNKGMKIGKNRVVFGRKKK
jgi:hypothetical protein